MKQCPRCGNAVPDTQGFCGSCGADVRALVAPAPRVNPVGSGQPSPYAYSSTPSPYGAGGFDAGGNGGQSPTMRYVVIGAVVLLVACCAFSCGLLASFAIDPIVSPMLRTPVPTPTRTPRGAPPAGGAMVWLLWYLLP